MKRIVEANILAYVALVALMFMLSACGEDKSDYPEYAGIKESIQVASTGREIKVLPKGTLTKFRVVGEVDISLCYIHYDSMRREVHLFNDCETGATELASFKYDLEETYSYLGGIEDWAVESFGDEDRIYSLDIPEKDETLMHISSAAMSSVDQFLRSGCQEVDSQECWGEISLAGFMVKEILGSIYRPVKHILTMCVAFLVVLLVHGGIVSGLNLSQDYDESEGHFAGLVVANFLKNIWPLIFVVQLLTLIFIIYRVVGYDFNPISFLVNIITGSVVIVLFLLSPLALYLSIQKLTMVVIKFFTSSDPGA